MELFLEHLRAYGTSLFRRRHVVGVGIGEKEVGGRPTGETCLVVLVEQKLPVEALAQRDRVPRYIGELATDVMEVGRVSMLVSEEGRKQRLRPARPGVSIGHFASTAGTLGALVRDRKSGALMILSNNHVLANLTSGKDGRARIGDPILQPGPYDGGRLEDEIASLERFLPIHPESEEPACSVALGAERIGNRLLRLIRLHYRLRLERAGRQDNLADAAVARVTRPGTVAAEILEVGGVRGVQEPRVGTKVMKSGRTSGVTRGRIRAIHATISVQMGDLRPARFRDQVVLSAMAWPGDSGSLVLTPDGRAVALLAAGSSLASIAAPIQTVLDLLEVDLVTA